MQNLHKHSFFSNIFIADSAASNEDYAKRAVELGHKTLSSVEHGWQGNYFQTYELAKKYGLKPVIGTEAYWVKDRLAEYVIPGKNGKDTLVKDRSNHHILLLAKSNMGREAINDVLSEANISGYYYRPRLDLPLLLSLPAKDVMVSSACIAFNGYEDIDNIILELHNHFDDNFMLELQYHNTDAQKDWNRHLIAMSKRYNISLTVGLDSHYIYPEDSSLRDYILEAKKISYEDEAGWYMDYPDDDTVMERFTQQGVLTEEQIKSAMNNTDAALEFCDYDSVRIFTKDIKLPTLYPDLTKEEKDKKYSKLITKKFKEYMQNVPTEDYDRYYEGVKSEIQTYKDTGMCDYPLLDYAIVNDAIAHGGLITDTGRGSAVGFFTNTLCGFSKVDRFTSAIKLYPERFISTTRILTTKSLPDIDLNVGTPEIFEESQKRVLGDNHVAPMIAFGTLKKKSAFKLYARAKNMDFDLANTISDQIGKYDEAVKNAPDDEKDEINIYDYIDKQYKDYLEQSENYWGVVSDKKKAPSAYLLYDGDIRREIGLIKCKSESTKKEYITCVIDGAVAENYKFLKNDILKVDVVLLIDKVFKRIGCEHFNVNTLIKKVKDDPIVWDLYAKGYTIGLNQVEQEGSRQKCMRYKPSNISELSAFVAAIRPGFKSMYKRFENRENFSWGIPTLDNLLKTKELPVSFLFFQEQVMSVLNYGGLPLDECYGAIKSISKKHPEKVKPLKEQFIKGFKERLMQDENISDEVAQKNAEAVWVIINDNCGYGFNSAHAYSMALDSLYQAWQKAHHPYEFYEVLLQHYADKGNKEKVAALKVEMKKAFNIKEGSYKFRDDNRHFTADPEHHQIIPALASIKGLSHKIANELYNLKDNQYTNFIELLVDLKNTTVDSAQLDILIKIGFFSEFGEINELLKQVEIFNGYYGRKQINKNSLDLTTSEIVKRYSNETEKMYKVFDSIGLLNELVQATEYDRTTPFDKIQYQLECLGYTDIICPKTNAAYYCVLERNNNWLTLYQLKTGETIKVKSRSNVLESNPVEPGNIIKVLEVKEEPSYHKDNDGKWQRDYNNMEEILRRYQVIEFRKA